MQDLKQYLENYCSEIEVVSGVSEVGDPWVAVVVGPITAVHVGYIDGEYHVEDMGWRNLTDAVYQWIEEKRENSKEQSNESVSQAQ